MGKWRRHRGDRNQEGVLRVKKLDVSRVDVLKFVYDALDAEYGTATHETEQQIGSVPPVALWSTGQVGEFRLAFGRPYLNNVRDIGYFPYWASFDISLHSRGAPIDLLYWKNGVLTSIFWCQFWKEEINIISHINFSTVDSYCICH
jgi:hypothetical protein